MKVSPPARPTHPIAWSSLVKELPVTGQFAALQGTLYHLARLNALHLVRVWGELGQVVGYNGALWVGANSVRLTASTQYVAANPDAAATLKAVQSAAYQCLQAAVSAQEATVVLQPSFNLQAPEFPSNEVALEAIRVCLPSLPEARTLGHLSYAECQERFPHTARFLSRRKQERIIEAKLKAARAAVIRELQSAGYDFDQNLRMVAPSGAQLTLALYYQPEITLTPGASHAGWAKQLAAAKAGVAPCLGTLRQKNLLVEEIKPSVTVTNGHPSGYTALPPIALAA